MAVIKQVNKNMFDAAAIRCGYFIFGQRRNWPEGVNGLIAGVTEECLIVEYIPDMSNVTNHYRIPVDEVVDGQWELRISPDLKLIEEIKDGITGINI